ncbi:MAG: DUF6775 family putative metallopeptidase [Nitrosopumilaceae archaeon]
MKISTVFLYDEPAVPEIRLEDLANFISNTFHIKVEIRKNIFNHFQKNIAQKIATCRIFDTKHQFEKHKPTNEEVRFEEESFANNKESNIIMYDGYEFQRIITNLIPPEELKHDEFHLVCTNKLMCTFDYDDYRFHGRTVICSNPAIISTTGMIEAPAKPREYYHALLSNLAVGLNVESIKHQFKGRYLEYHDPKIGEIVKGFALQAMFYYLTGESFCDSKECRLFNAHWQNDLLHSQINVGKLCERHQKVLDKILLES